MNTLSIGTISSGTLSNRDLLESLAKALDDAIRENPATADDNENSAVYDAYCAINHYDSTGEDHDESGEVIERLFEMLQGFAPRYCCVGAHPGDGAEIGVWPDWDQVEMDEYDGYLVRIDAGDEFPDPEPDGPGALLVVTDHGNATLYVRTPNADFEPTVDEWREEWSIV